MSRGTVARSSSHAEKFPTSLIMLNGNPHGLSDCMRGTSVACLIPDRTSHLSFSPEVYVCAEWEDRCHRPPAVRFATSGLKV